MPHHERGARDTGTWDIPGLESAHSCLSLGTEEKSMKMYRWIGGKINTKLVLSLFLSSLYSHVK
jgi:hypothetical protein